MAFSCIGLSPAENGAYLDGKLNTQPFDDVAVLAANLARNRGWHVFPSRDDKRPACRHRFKDATSKCARATRGARRPPRSWSA